MLPQGWDRRTIVLLTFAFLFVITANLAHAQVFDLERDRVQMAELNGLWRFHTGDDPDGKLGWADPRFDDSSWPMLYADQPWNDPRYQGYSGFAWFRIKVRRPVTPMLLALFIPNLPRSYRVFAEGIAIGGIGGMPPHESIVLAHDQIYLLPRPREDARETSTLAFRVWYSRTPRALNGGPSGREGNLRIGDAIVIENWRRFVLHDAFWQIVIVACQLPFELIAAIAGFVLFVFSRSEKEYLWFAGFNFTGGVFDCWAIHSRFFATPRWEEFWVIVISVSGYWLLITLFLFSLLKTRRNWLYWCTLASLLFAFFAEVVRQSNLPTALWKIVTYPLVHFAVIVCLALVIYKGAKRGSEDARFLLVPFLGFLGWEFLGTFLNLMHELGTSPSIRLGKGWRILALGHFHSGWVMSSRFCLISRVSSS